MLAKDMTSAEWMRIQNARSILSLIKENDVISRKDIAKKTNLATQTVTNIAAILIEHNLIREAPLPVQGKGRNPIALSLDYSQFTMISVQIASRSLNAYCHNLSGEVFKHHFASLNKHSTNTLDILKSVLEDFSNNINTPIEAIVVSVEGIVDAKNLVIMEAKDIRLENVSLYSELSYLNIPLFLCNDVDLLAHYEKSHRNDCDTNFMVVRIDNGIGASLVINKSVMTSTNCMAGELGHYIIPGKFPPRKCKCGRTNCLTQYISKGSLENQLEKDYEQIKECVALKDEKATEIIKEIADNLWGVLANLIVLLDLDRIVLTGCIVEDFGCLFLDDLIQKVMGNLCHWTKFQNIEVQQYNDFPAVCISYLLDCYFAQGNDRIFLWDNLLLSQYKGELKT